MKWPSLVGCEDDAVMTQSAIVNNALVCARVLLSARSLEAKVPVMNTSEVDKVLKKDTLSATAEPLAVQDVLEVPSADRSADSADNKLTLEKKPCTQGVDAIREEIVQKLVDGFQPDLTEDQKAKAELFVRKNLALFSTG